jgi:hypothetical protein
MLCRESGERSTLVGWEKIDAGLVTAIVRGEVGAVKSCGRCRRGGRPQSRRSVEHPRHSAAALEH